MLGLPTQSGSGDGEGGVAGAGGTAAAIGGAGRTAVTTVVVMGLF